MKVILFFTYGISLHDWKESGLLSREIQLYKQLHEKYNIEFAFLTYGDSQDLDTINLPFIKIFPIYKYFKKSKNKYVNLFKSITIPFKISKELKEFDIFKTNQLLGSWVAIISKIKLDLELYQIALFLFILNRVTPSLQMTLNALLNFLVNFQSLRVIIELCKSAELNKEKLTGVISDDKEINSVKFENVFFKYEKKNINTLNNISFAVHKGESLGLIGSSGSGKSSLLNILTGFYKIDAGKILINNSDLNKMHIKNFRKRISYLPQTPELFNNTIKKNLLLGITRKVQSDELISVLKKCYCDFVFRFPEKLDSKVGDRGMLISGGQRQRLVIARAILNKSDLIILDEATNGLDEKSEKKIKYTLQKFKNKTIQIICSHRISTIENTDKLLYLDNGNLIKFGRTKTMLNDKMIKNFFNKI